MTYDSYSEASNSFIRNGKTLLSGIDPVRRCERLADAVSIKDRTLYFCPSPLFGYGLSRFLSRLETEAPNSAVLCIEADEELYTLAKSNIESSLTENKRMHLANICEEFPLQRNIHQLYTLINNIWGARAFRGIETLRLSGGWQLFPELYDSLCELLRREIASDWSNALTMTKLGRLYIRNALRNLALLSRFPSVSNLSFGSLPVLVLGAGPSLDFTLDALAAKFPALYSPDARPFKIICVDTCIGALKDRNIMPDLAVILESQHWNLRDFIGCSGWNIPAALDLSSLPASSKKLNGEGYLFMTPWTTLRVFERLKSAELLPAVLPPLGSVGLTAVELARRLTGGKIVCAGLDFSFTLDMCHARSTPGHRDCLNKQNRLHRLQNSAACGDRSSGAISKSGFSVRTNAAMKHYRDLFEHEFSGDSRLFDIESSGLPLGIKTLSMDEAFNVLGILPERQDSRIANSSFLRSSRSGEIKNKLNSFYEEENNRLKELREILTGETAADKERLKILINECDYLWAHFPDYTGGRNPDLEDISFLKRIRAEIDPMIALIKRLNLYT